MEAMIPYILHGDPARLRQYWDEPIEALSSIVRGCFCAAPGMELICSDFSAIEAVCAAAIAGEEWRLEVFRTHGKIYEMSASKISGVPFEEMMEFKERTGNDHPLRKKLGKVSELASAYQGWVNAWKQFGADKFFDNDEEIKEAILAWRKDSPKIVAMWGACETAAINAILNPGHLQRVTDAISYLCYNEVLYCQVNSGDIICYQKPWLTTQERFKKLSYKINYWGNNRDPKKGPMGWHERDTYGGRLFENIVQKVARDLLAFSLVNLEKHGYPVVLHVHDEVAAEIPEGTGNIPFFESIMAQMPPWANGWPVRAAGGWIGKRFRKE
jgi:DNA polymerase